ncbi:Oxoglutarate/iron-dependent dioxygenase [Penicillium macrosclerotiorum]|uniref:Oxoglutarate/iron-dependent dioxygenase n=1 Tax=Penicillium macrosclerotiorum TaxID=303699 RepID=UPI002546E993|nr:Oxoglutarate/iron-dependent dioxygenase [Penicillium macrosclerotiorum]KAJ5691851.1 Oxoglutarate/iron-dependent dioxygenase [Penicillium macrosclerotiorum]
MAKRTLDAFFKPVVPSPPEKRAKRDHDSSQSPPSNPVDDRIPPSVHPSYPCPIAGLPSHIAVALTHGTPARPPRPITNQPNLDLLYFKPYITRPAANELFKFLRASLPFYRVQYTIKRGGVPTEINTPRYTTVFGVDDTSIFIPEGEAQQPSTPPGESHDPPEATSHRHKYSSQEAPDTDPDTGRHTDDLIPVSTHTRAPIRASKYDCTPRPLPACLAQLRDAVEAVTDAQYNFCLVNYYASGSDSIAFHSDDERFLGGAPCIASLSLGGERDFVMKHKPAGAGEVAVQAEPVKMALGSGDMVVMRGATQAHWLHSVPKRRGRSGEDMRGRINITFRRAVVPGGTNNYYHYNVGSGGVWRWDEVKGQMVLTRDGRE